ncbi:MAG: NAD-dependent protein deacylase [Methyloligella sp.]|nr:MAG: NAD-dependent protein deacylase [Methyloligella sp.]
MPLYDKILILTGAGLSAESGLGTFREENGIWSKYNFEEVATPEGYAADPKRCLDFYNMRRDLHHKATPNTAHKALARLEAEYPGEVVIVTQNIDSLHEAAGSHRIIHMHGQIDRVKCNDCGTTYDYPYGTIEVNSICPSCNVQGQQRPDVVWFGEMPYDLDEIQKEIDSCFLFISIGTSGSVYPAAGFVNMARKAGAHTVELNLEPSDGAVQFHEAHQGKATEIVPRYVDKLMHEAAIAQKKVVR